MDINNENGLAVAKSLALKHWNSKCPLILAQWIENLFNAINIEQMAYRPQLTVDIWKPFLDIWA